jgi:hypothetical protein
MRSDRLESMMGSASGEKPGSMPEQKSVVPPSRHADSSRSRICGITAGG